jgi:hypothetical protein
VFTLCERSSDDDRFPRYPTLPVLACRGYELPPMALSYSLDAERKLITITGEYAEADEWAALLARIGADPALAPGFAFLRDLRGAQRPVTAAAVVALMEAVRRFWPILEPSRAAVLTPREFDAAAMAAHALADSYALPLKMFTSYDAAIEWLLAPAT